MRFKWDLFKSFSFKIGTEQERASLREAFSLAFVFKYTGWFSFLCHRMLSGKAVLASSSLFQGGILFVACETLIPKCVWWGEKGGWGLWFSFYLSWLLINNLRRMGLTIHVLYLKRRAFVLCRFFFSSSFGIETVSTWGAQPSFDS